MALRGQLQRISGMIKGVQSGKVQRYALYFFGGMWRWQLCFCICGNKLAL